MKKGVSLILCCYNSSSRLPATLRHIAMQQVHSDINWEVIIVNNNSTDNTKEIAIFEWQKYNINIPIRIIDEPQQGLTFARKRGVFESNYHIIIFCDDDNWLDACYLEKAYLTMQFDSTIGALGGQSEAVSNAVIPEWFYNVNGYAVGKQASMSGILTDRYHLWGAGLVTRRSIMKKVFKEPLLLSDRKKNLIISGGDSEICARILLMEYKLYYREDLFFKHFIPGNRLTLDYREKLINGFKSTRPIINKYFEFIEIKKESYWAKFNYTWKKLIKLILLQLRFSKSKNNQMPLIKERLAMLLLFKPLSKDPITIAIIKFMSSI